MAKAPKKAVEVKVDTKTIATQKNRERRLARHLKAHPNDVQSKDGFKGTARSKPKSKGNFPEAKVWIVDEAGNKELFVSESKFAKHEEVWETTRRIRDEEKRAKALKEKDNEKRQTRRRQKPSRKA